MFLLFFLLNMRRSFSRSLASFLLLFALLCLSPASFAQVDQPDTTSTPTETPTTRSGTDGFTLEEAGTRITGNVPRLGIEGEGDPVKMVQKVLLNYVITPIFFVAGGVAVIIIIYSGFRIVIARGEEEGITVAKNSFLWALLGLGLIMVSYTLVRNLAELIIGLI